HSDWIALDPDVMRDIAAQFDPALADERKVFAAGSAPASPALYMRQRTLFDALHDDPYVSTLEVEETVIGLAEAALGSALRFWPRNGRRRPRAIARARALAIVDATQSILAREYASSLGIREIAGRVHCSPGYLSRLFRSTCGFSLHHYQQQLRLRAALGM